MIIPKEPTKILLAGDIHGEYKHFRFLVDRALETGCQTIVQLGDFGYWPHDSDGKQYLDNVSRILALKGLECVFIDGNHENHELLRRELVDPDTGWVEPRPFLFYAPRGQRWEWQKVKFLALGGAYSIDERSRTQGVSWWPEETITYGEALGAAEDGKTDIMLCHDAPSGIPFGNHERDNKDLWPQTVANRDLLKGVFDAVRPRMVFHGHWHFRHTTQLEQAVVVGLDCGDRPELSSLVLDLTPWF